MELVHQELERIRVVQEQAALEQAADRERLTSTELALLLGVKDNNPRVS